ncbi:MAG TPA: hypothetical protein EYN38_11430 [Flavobacteriales bacterium]|nr:hypothetical protein [Flavobacteriales bacterium]HIA13280.1 hypothetical protein [Flavobacteriales bacterium]HIO73705.1 hypothetical protein [Flavobacteriales bacterium]
MLIKTLVNIRNFIDRKVKFPFVKKGDTVIQVGFEMSSPNLTTDLFLMQKAVGNTGLTIGVDPDPLNIADAAAIAEKHKLNVKLIQSATFSKYGKGEMIMGHRAGGNILDCVPTDADMIQTDRRVEVEFDTLDSLMAKASVDVVKISFVNITNNGAEYDTLIGMRNILKEAENLEISMIAGRPGKMGLIDGRSDVEVKTEFLNTQGYKTKFYRFNQLLWCSINHMYILREFWKNDKTMEGVLFAVKKDKNFSPIQSYS